MTAATWKLLFPTVTALLIAAITCIAIPVSLVAIHIKENPAFSPIDEAAHWDYVTRLANGGFPRMGQVMQPSTLRALECRPSALAGEVLPPCGTPPVASKFPGAGDQYEAQQPPGYYAISVPMRWFGTSVLGLGDLTATRLTGMVWLVLALLIFWGACRLMDVDPEVIGAGALLIGTAPLVIYQYSYVSNDVTGLLSGSLVLLLGALAWRKPGRWMTPVMLVAGLVIADLKLDDLLPIVVASAMFALVAFGPGHADLVGSEGVVPSLRWWWPRGGALLVGGVVSMAAWLVVERHLAIINPKDLPAFGVLRTAPVTAGTVLREALSLLQPLTGSYAAFKTTVKGVSTSSPQAASFQVVLSTLLGYLLIAGGASGLFVTPRRWHHRLGLLTLPTLYIGGIVLGASVYLSYNTDPGLSGRYGLALVPMLVVALVASLRGVWLVRAVWLFGLVTLGASYYFMLAS